MSLIDLFKRHDRNRAESSTYRPAKVAAVRELVNAGDYDTEDAMNTVCETLAEQYGLAHREDQQLDPQALRAREAAERIVDTKRPAVQCEMDAERWDGLS
jgi:hypothetical protein